MLKREPRRKPKQTEEETVKPKEDNRKSDPIRRQRIDPVLQINKGPSKTKTKSTEKYLWREWCDRVSRKTSKDKRPTRTPPTQCQTETDRESTKTVNEMSHIQRATDSKNGETTPQGQEGIPTPFPKRSSPLCTLVHA